MRRVAGVDEAGRGPLAGPVVAAAVILRRGKCIDGVADSKALTPEERTRLSAIIRRDALCFGIGWADRAEIDALNILQATFLAMRRAVLAMALAPDHLLVDGNRLPNLTGLGKPVTARAIIGGDALSPAISAASILAKTARDAYMNHMDTIYPQYSFATHKGYCTPTHRRLLALHGPCPLHRQSFAPVHDAGLGLVPRLGDLTPRPGDHAALTAGDGAASPEATAPPVASGLAAPPRALAPIQNHPAEARMISGLESAL
jgi:ribonuclease HII